MIKKNLRAGIEIGPCFSSSVEVKNRPSGGAWYWGSCRYSPPGSPRLDCTWSRPSGLASFRRPLDHV